jgi:hypothetical protein
MRVRGALLVDRSGTYCVVTCGLACSLLVHLLVYVRYPSHGGRDARLDAGLLRELADAFFGRRYTCGDVGPVGGAAGVPRQLYEDVVRGLLSGPGRPPS